MHVPNLAAFPHLDVSICPCQPSWRTISPLISPSSSNFPMGGVPPRYPPHPISTIPTLCIHAHSGQPSPHLGSVPTCTPFCTPPCTLCAIFSWVFLTPTPLPVPWHTSISIPWPMGREILLSGQDSNLLSPGAYKGSALMGG